jgi:ribosomal protein L12E/L44/L45/RPP1/RPP2
MKIAKLEFLDPTMSAISSVDRPRAANLAEETAAAAPAAGAAAAPAAGAATPAADAKKAEAPKKDEKKK